MTSDKLTPEQRFRLHALFEHWLCNASEGEYQEFANLRELIAPGEVCSVVRIALTCMGDPVMVHRLPESLRDALIAESWLIERAAA